MNQDKFQEYMRKVHEQDRKEADEEKRINRMFGIGLILAIIITGILIFSGISGV